LLTQAWALALPTGADASLIASRTAATSSLQSHCGTCHDGARASAEPAAVRAFDLSRADWSTTLADEDLRGLVDRIDARGDVPRGDRAQVASFVAAELRARRG
jgi:hypothetical protein